MDKTAEKIKKYVRAANYITVSQIYLQNNFLLERPLIPDDIKPRLLGHWGTCPGINFVYGNLNYLIKKHRISMLFVLGPGHGFPALQSNLFLEGTLKEYYPRATQNINGLSYISKNFSWPFGFPSHSNPGAPGSILEGGELGYSLSTSYGAVLDNPDLIVACLIGDGEAETGALATSWHINKLISPKNNGAVLPILHVNGYKISGPSIMGRLTNNELESLFTGYGYKPIIVENENGKDIYKTMINALESAYQKIRHIQKQARLGENTIAPKFPMIILKTPKGWTGIKELDGEKLEGNNLSHQVIAGEAKTNDEHLKALEAWMKSYNFNEIFDKKNGLINDIKDIIPELDLAMGENDHSYSGRIYKKLLLPKVDKFEEDAFVPGTVGSSNMRRAGLYLNEVFKLNDKSKNFRLMSPDEIYSNKLDAVLDSTNRAFVWPVKPWDKSLKPDGRVMEILSEHSLQGLAQGYLLTGRHVVFSTYEAFAQIISSMADQYLKFLKVARETKWRGDIASFNYILTSSGWRQDHNGFSHQNPGFLSDMMDKQGGFIHAYFPPDGNSTLVVMEKCLESKNCLNIIVAGKTVEPRWLTVSQAEEEIEKGIMTWDFASDKNPDIVLVGIGDYVTKEALAAVDIIKKECPEIRVRFVNIIELSPLFEAETDFEEYFTKDKPVIFNFHGYPETLKKLLFNRNDTERFSIHGYLENGSTTTPFDMQVRNHTSRYHLALEAFNHLAKIKVMDKRIALYLTKKYESKLLEHHEYIRKFGVDMDEVENWVWKR